TLNAVLDPNGPVFYAGFDADTGGDPRVIYDQFSNRFIVMTMRLEPARLYLAVSKGYDPVMRPNDPDSPSAEDWDKFDIDARLCLSYDPQPTDCTHGFHYGGLAVTPEAIYVTSIQDLFYVLGEPGRGHSIRILRKPPVGETSAFFENSANYKRLFVPLNSNEDPKLGNIITLPMPAQFLAAMSPETMYFVQIWKHNDNGNSRLRVFAVTDPLGTPVLHTFELPPIPRIRPAVPGGQLCPPVPFVLPSLGNVQNVVWRSGRLYFAFEDAPLVPPGQVRRMIPRWYEVATNGWPHSGQNPSILQSGGLDGGRVWINDNPADDRPVDFTYPNIMLSGTGPTPDMALFVHRIYSRGYVDVCWTGRRASDAAGQLGAAITIMQASSAGFREPAHPGRFGEYQGVS
ncbi:MAG: hypothetical protein ACREUU_21060, partial [Gammaproteobacteria bacterium]